MARRARNFLIFGILLLAGGLWRVGDAHAQGLVRDTEIENTIRAYAAPLLSVAGLEHEAFNVHLVRSDELNAFVARGQRLFLTTGLLRRSENAEQVIGVIAHEVGHIAGGHLARLQGALEDASTAALIAQLIGVAVGVVAQQGAAGMAIGGGGAHVAERSLLQFSRTQENSADQAAVRFLDQAGIPLRGLTEFMEVLANQEFLAQSRQDPYARTHPLSRERLDFLRNQLGKSDDASRKLPTEFKAMHARMVAKLDGFLDPPGTTLRKYPETDNSVVARYARAMAYYRTPDMDRALPLIDGLIAEEPKNAYFHELKGQMLFENGRLNEALGPYDTAVRLMPGAPQIRSGLAHVQLEMQRNDILDQTVGHLEAALNEDRFYAPAWRLLGMAYGRKDELGMSAWALAEYNMLIGRRKDAQGLAERASRLLKRGEPAWLRAQDILHQSKRDE
ncbi:MAG: M48 family metalloprotease [Alphaproteobacteria bacterium]|nr:M48 family metalloprotease [Alphaproteobacteria bacterium]